MQDDLVFLPSKVAKGFGEISPLLLCTRVSSALVLTDPATLRSIQIEARTCLFGSKRLSVNRVARSKGCLARRDALLQSRSDTVPLQTCSVKPQNVSYAPVCRDPSAGMHAVSNELHRHVAEAARRRKLRLALTRVSPNAGAGLLACPVPGAGDGQAAGGVRGAGRRGPGAERRPAPLGTCGGVARCS